MDEIAQGKEKLVTTVEKFWEPFEKQVIKVTEEAEKMKVVAEETDEKCDVCGRPMVIRYGRFGKFLACSGFPECKNTKTLAAPTGLTCPLDGGNIVVKCACINVYICAAINTPAAINIGSAILSSFV